MKKILCVISAAIMLLLLVTACGKTEQAEITQVSQLDNKAYIIGVPTGTTAANIIEKEMKNAQKKYFSSLSDGYLAVQQGKIDAFSFDKYLLQFAIVNGLKGVKVMQETIGEPENVAIGISRSSDIDALEQKINEAVAALKADGTLDDMFERWVVNGENTMPEIAAAENPDFTFTVGTSGEIQPFSYYEGTDLTGFDIELANRIALYLNAKLELKVYGYEAFPAALETGAIDCVMANLNATEERRETMAFSDTIYESETALLIKDGDEALNDESVPVETSRLGVMDGSTNAVYAEENYPDAKIQSFKNYVDSTAALNSGKLDYAMMDYTSALRFIRSNKNLGIVSDALTDEKVCLGISKREPELAEQVSDVVDKYISDGTMDEIVSHWIKPDASDYDVLETPKLDNAPVINVAIISSREPTTFLLNGKYAGLDIELIDRVLYELGYTAKYIDVELSALMATIETGKADMTLGMYSTPEREEKLYFTAPYFANPQVLLAKTDTAAANTKTGIIDSLKASFTRTFITEGRWRLVLGGLWVTVYISVLSGIVGSLFGFGLCMLRRSKNRIGSSVTAAFIRLIQGTPIVVLLMILYYVIFGKADISAALVAVLGFAINFGVYTAEIMRTGIDAVDKGQIEASYALGFTKVQTFAKITFPQAARHFLPVFKGEFISMVKMTSVVGYIAIQDLTKVSDIIRSRTLEAFFPLIATAVIYFIIANLMTMLLSRIELSLDPKRRKVIVTK